LHDALLRQFAPFLHAPSVLHWMSHLYPVGQTTVFVQLVAWQLIVQVFCPTLHEVQADGQPPPSPLGASLCGASTCEPLTTQKPSLHTRPGSQSVFLVQAYLSLA